MLDQTLTPEELEVLTLLADTKKGFVTYKTIADKLGLSIQTIQEIVLKLKNLNLIIAEEGSLQ